MKRHIQGFSLSLTMRGKKEEDDIRIKKKRKAFKEERESNQMSYHHLMLLRSPWDGMTKRNVESQ